MIPWVRWMAGHEILQRFVLFGVKFLGAICFAHMGDHVAVDVGELVASRVGEAAELVSGGKEETEALIGMVECRICQEEDLAKNLESPCACSGSLKYAHRECVQRWCNEKGDITCEICHESYKPGYTAPTQVHHDETTIEISGGDWTISGNRLDLHHPRILAMAAAQDRLLEDEYDEYTVTNNNAAAFCRSIFLILMALLLLRHTLTITNSDDEDGASAIFSEEAMLLPTEVAIILHRNGRTMQFAVAPPESPISPQPEPNQ
ncbi:uncharacterized protein [Miscanthus floridulus]|uniref:uncharacterized protein isoform X2 n=1 Tax=Miscanthus floridulus TaxID=154761 RepID=UPI003459C155